MAESRSPVRPRPVSGFPEYLPELRAVELRWMDEIRAAFESFGYANLETPIVETLEVLMAKGETDKEIYVLDRLQAEPDAKPEARLGLRFDLTVPTARYVAQHFNDLTFPFKRWQMARVYRGERPQAGRFREFTQADCDVIAVDRLPLFYDAEMIQLLGAALARLARLSDLPPVTLHVSNRKILQGYLNGLGLADPLPAIRCLDRLDKVGPAGVRRMLVEQAGLPPDRADRAAALADIRGPVEDCLDRVRSLGVADPRLDEGLAELRFVLAEAAGAMPVVADLSIARGFDYYTGTVYEGRAAFGADGGDVMTVAGGGRYDDLAGEFIAKRLPGVGISLGVSRLFGRLVAAGRIAPAAPTPTQVLVILPSEDRRAVAAAAAAALRARGLRVELFAEDAKLKRQLTYAERKRIPYVWFPPFEDGRPHEVKDMASGAQSEADPTHWQPPG